MQRCFLLYNRTTKICIKAFAKRDTTRYRVRQSGQAVKTWASTKCLQFLQPALQSDGHHQRRLLVESDFLLIPTKTTTTCQCDLSRRCLHEPRAALSPPRGVVIVVTIQLILIVLSVFIRTRSTTDSHRWPTVLIVGHITDWFMCRDGLSAL